jgi:hypothetical protein
MSKYCEMAKKSTNCSCDCKECARDEYYTLKSMVGNAEYMSEEGIKMRVGEDVFELLRKYGFIELCGSMQGTKIYAL